MVAELLVGLPPAPEAAALVTVSDISLPPTHSGSGGDISATVPRRLGYRLSGLRGDADGLRVSGRRNIIYRLLYIGDYYCFLKSLFDT